MNTEDTDEKDIVLPAGLCALAGFRLPVCMSPGLYRKHLRSNKEGAILNTLIMLQDMPSGWEASFGELTSELEIDGGVKKLNIRAVEVVADEPWILLCLASEMKIVPLWEQEEGEY